jgi:hypothetical protein
MGPAVLKLEGGVMPVPTRESELVTWSQNLSTRLVAGPSTLYGVPVATGTLLQTRADAYQAAYELAANDATKTRGVVASKNDAKRLMLQTVSDVCRLIAGTSTVTDQQKYDLGVTVPKQPQPIPAYPVAPGLEVMKVDGRLVTVRVFDTTNPTKRGKPYGVATVAVFSHIGGEVAPTDPDAFKWEGNTARMSLVVEFPPSTAPGTKVWLTATFQSERGLTSPACIPVSANIGFGGPALLGESA